MSAGDEFVLLSVGGRRSFVFGSTISMLFLRELVLRGSLVVSGLPEPLRIMTGGLPSFRLMYSTFSRDEDLRTGEGRRSADGLSTGELPLLAMYALALKS